MRFSRQEYRSELPFPSPGDLPDPGIEPMSPAWQADSSPLSHQGSLWVFLLLSNLFVHPSFSSLLVYVLGSLSSSSMKFLSPGKHTDQGAAAWNHSESATADKGEIRQFLPILHMKSPRRRIRGSVAIVRILDNVWLVSCFNWPALDHASPWDHGHEPTKSSRGDRGGCCCLVT